VNIVQLTPGAAGMYCGSCMRDNALTTAFRRQGHDALLVPLYTPLKTDEKNNSAGRIFFGGLNVFLQQKTSMFRNTPGWLDRALDHPGLLNFATSFGIRTKPHELGELTVSMLKGEDGNQKKEVDKLAEWLKGTHKPDVVILSNAILCGMLRRLKQDIDAPIIVTLQGEDFFLDGLPDDLREESWKLLAERAAEADGFIAVSKYYADEMTRRLKLSPNKVHAVHNGIELDGYAPASAPPTVPTIGYLARFAVEKGIRTLLDAFIKLKAMPGMASARLRLAGSLTPTEQPLFDELKATAAKAGFAAAVDFLPNVSREDKVKFLQSLSVLSVPAAYGESFGLYVLEALACGVPVVQPSNAAFPELLAATGGGILCEPNNSDDLAKKLAELLAQSDVARALGETGRRVVLEKYGIDSVARELAEIYARTGRERESSRKAGVAHAQ